MQFSAYSEFTLAHTAAKLLRDVSQESHILIAENDCTVLDDVLIAGDQASLGVHPASLARPVPQLLLLTLRLCWKPLNPLHLLEFLTHPNCPVEFHLRNELSRVMVECPGIGGPKWLGAIEAVKEIYQAKPADEAKELFPRLEKDLADWIYISKYATRTGASGAEISGHCLRIAKWARHRLIKENEQGDFAKASLFQSLATQASELGEAVKETEAVTQCELERLVRRVSGNGWSSPKIRELGHGHRVGSPAACIESADTVLWWNFSEPERPALPHWTNAEVEALQKHGAEIPTAASILMAESAHWLKPFLSARKKLVLFTPRQRNGEPVATHPLFSRLQAMVEGKFPTTHLDVDLQRKKVPFAEQIKHTALRTPRRWWKSKDGTHFGPRPTESFSSAEKFIYSPYSWVLDYKAVLRPGVLSQFRMRSENVLNGKKWRAVLERSGLFRLPGEDAQVWRERSGKADENPKDSSKPFDFREELWGERGRPARDWEADDTADLMRLLEVPLEVKELALLSEGWRSLLSFPEQNGKLLIAMRRYQSRIARLHRWCWFLKGDDKQKQTACDEITECEDTRLISAEQIAQAKKHDPRLKTELESQLQKRLELAPGLLVRIANRVLPLRGRSWHWEKHPSSIAENTLHHLTQNGPKLDTKERPVWLRGQRGLSLERIVVKDSARCARFCVKAKTLPALHCMNWLRFAYISKDDFAFCKLPRPLRRIKCLF